MCHVTITHVETVHLKKPQSHLNMKYYFSFPNSAFFFQFPLILYEYSSYLFLFHRYFGLCISFIPINPISPSKLFKKVIWIEIISSKYLLLSKVRVSSIISSEGLQKLSVFLYFHLTLLYELGHHSLLWHQINVQLISKILFCLQVIRDQLYVVIILLTFR